MLLAFLIYNDGILTVIRMAAIYGDEIGLDAGQMIVSILIVQFVGVPCTLLFGRFAGVVGARRAVLCGLAVYVVIALIARGMNSALDFLVMAGLVGLVQGGTQALSRSLFASMIPRERSGEFFGLFAVFDRFAGILGPLLFASIIAATGDVRMATLPLLGFFLVGGLALACVDVEAGRRAARSSPPAEGGE